MTSPTQLSDICEDVSYGFTASATDEDTGTRFLRITDIQGGKVDWETVPFCEVDPKSKEKHLLHENDIVVARTGNSTGENYLFSSDKSVVFASYLIRFRVDPNAANPKFVWYQMRSKRWWNFVSGAKTGSAQAGANAKILGSFEVNLPAEADQKAIAHILGTLDDKIELNQKMNQTLEEIAKSIFKSWFVDFDPVRAKAEGRPTGLPPEISDLFPDELVDSEFGEIPKGWEIKRVEEICEKIAMGPFGSNIKVSTFVDDGIPIISGHHLHNFLLREGDHKFITEEHAERLKNSLVRSGDVIFTHAGTVGQVSLIPSDSDYETYVISQRQFYARPLRPEYSAYLNFFFHSPVGQHKLLSNVSGSGVPSIARPSSHMKAIELTLADELLVRKFDQLVGPMIERMVLVSREIETLAELRDTLLPKLISGELRVPDAEKFLKEAGI